MKLNVRDAILIVVAAVIVAVIAVFAFPNLGSTSDTVVSSVSIDFYDAPAPIHQGNITTWTLVDGQWRMSSVDNGGHTIWVFRNLTSKSSCYDQLVAAAGIAHFSVESQNQSLGLIITAIGGDSNLQYEGRAWQYYVNGVYANRACSVITVGNGDQVIWKYLPNQMG